MGIYKVGQAPTGGGATVLDDLTDVNTPAPVDGEVLTYKNPPGEWQPDTATAVVATLDAVGDVDVPAPNDGDVLTFVNGTGNWEAVAPTGGMGALDDITDVDAAAPSDGDVLTFVNGTGNWEAVAPTVPPTPALDDLTDVDAAAPSDGDVLAYNNGTGNWEPNTPVVGLDDLADVDAAAPNDGDVLTFVGGSGNWEAVAPVVYATGPDDPPASPSAYDDEFTAGSLDAKWTLVTDTVAEKRYATTPSWLQAHFTGDQILTIGEAYAPGASVAFSVTAKCSHTGFNAGNYAFAGISAYADANNYLQVAIQWNGTTKALRTNRLLAGVLTNNVQTRNLAASGHDAMYIHMQRNAGTDYKFWCSTDGVGWFPISTTEAASAFAPNITEIRLHLNQAGQTAYAWAGWDWVRVNWLTL